MTQPSDPQSSPGSGRSIYERLGLTPAPSPLRPRPIPITPPPPNSRRILRYLIGIPLLLGGLALLWLNFPIGDAIRNPSFMPNANAEDESRIDQQVTQIKQLELRVEMLEMKVHALQAVNRYQAAAAGDDLARDGSAPPHGGHKPTLTDEQP